MLHHCQRHWPLTCIWSMGHCVVFIWGPLALNWPWTGLKSRPGWKITDWLKFDRVFKAIDHSMYVFWFQLYPSCLYLCDPRGAFWVQMCPAVRTQWTTPLRHYFDLKCCVVKAHTQAKIIKISMILSWLLNMSIWCKHVHRLKLQIFFNLCAAHLPLG